MIRKTILATLVALTIAPAALAEATPPIRPGAIQCVSVHYVGTRTSPPHIEWVCTITLPARKHRLDTSPARVIGGQQPERHAGRPPPGQQPDQRAGGRAMKRGRLTIRNATAYPTDEVEGLVRWAMADTKPAETLVVVRHTVQTRERRAEPGYWLRPYSGRAHDHVPGELVKGCPAGAWYAAILRIARPADGVYPMPTSVWRYGHEPIEGEDARWPPPEGWPAFRFVDWREALVYVAAHEAYHVEGYRERGHHHYRNRSAQAEELAAELFAASVIRRYREGVSRWGLANCLGQLPARHPERPPRRWVETPGGVAADLNRYDEGQW